jgi:hypothetical protein
MPFSNVNTKIPIPAALTRLGIALRGEIPIAYDPAWGFVATPSPLYANGLSCIWSSTDGVEWD